MQPDEGRAEQLVEPEARLGGSEQFARCWAVPPASQHWAVEPGERQRAHPGLEAVQGQSPAQQQSAAAQQAALPVLRRA